MTDTEIKTKIKKLPKWAQDHIAELEIKASLTFPIANPPKPFFKGSSRDARRLVNCDLMWSSNSSTMKIEQGVGFNNVKLYQTRDEASQELLYKVAMECALKMHMAMTVAKEG